MTNGTGGSWADVVPRYWPVILSVLGIVIVGAQADAKNNDNARRIGQLEIVAPLLDRRLSQIEVSVSDIKAAQDANHNETSAAISRMDDKLDRLIRR